MGSVSDPEKIELVNYRINPYNDWY